MNSDEASQLLWQSLWDVEQYLREGIAKQLNASTSFSGDDMIPVHEAIRTFQIVSPLLPPGAQSTVERVFSETTSGLNGFLDSLRASIEISKTDVAQRQAAIGRAKRHSTKPSRPTGGPSRGRYPVPCLPTSAAMLPRGIRIRRRAPMDRRRRQRLTRRSSS